MNTEIHLKRVNYSLIWSTTLISSLQILLQLLSSIYCPLLKCWHSTQCLFSKSHRLRYDASTVWHVNLVAGRCKWTNSTAETKSGLVEKEIWLFSGAYGSSGSNLFLVWNAGIPWWKMTHHSLQLLKNIFASACMHCFFFFFVIK